jgi:hypothetical protein
MAARKKSATHWKQLVARIRVPGGGEQRVGTGTLITRQHVLTAWHVVAPDGAFVSDLQVDLLDLDPSLKGLAASFVWRHDTDDLALLRLVDQIEIQAQLQLAEREPESAVEGEIYGFARGGKTANSTHNRVAVPFVVTLHTPSLRNPLNIAPHHPADVWSGLSGAPVVYDGRILGVVSAKNHWSKCTRLLATSVVSFVVPLRKALSNGQGDEATEQDAVEKLLDGNADVLSALARHAATTRDPRSVAAWLRCAGSRELADSIDVARRNLRDLDGAHDDLRALVELLLPRLAVWSALRSSVAGELAAQGVPMVETPELNELLVEALSASLDGRRCAFVPRSLPLVGWGLVPTGLENGPDPRGERFARSVLADLYRHEGGGLQDPDGGALKVVNATSLHTKLGPVTVAAQAKFVEASLKLRVSNNDPSEPPLYVILCDRAETSADRYLEQVARQLSALLPSLRIFRVRIKLDTPDELLYIHARVHLLFASQ